MKKNPVVHFDIGCRDLKKARAFYSALFGWDTKDYGPLSAMVDTGPAGGDSDAPPNIHGAITALGHEPHNYTMLYVQVDDITAAAQKAVSLGGSIMVPETEAPGMGRFAWIRDPEGTLVGLWKPRAS